MPAAPRSPLDGTGRLIVDGTNLLWRIGGPRGTAAPPAAIIGRVRASIPPAVTIELVFDGIGHGLAGRVAQQMFVRYSGRRTGYETILEQAGLEDEAVLVVTDDRALRERLLARGIRSAPLVWLLGRLQLPALSSPAPGNRRSPIRPAGGWRDARSESGGGPGPAGAKEEEDVRVGWKPGRGATAKTGTPHKVARHKRHPKHT